jgi:hypothetical protein
VVFEELLIWMEGCVISAVVLDGATRGVDENRLEVRGNFVGRIEDNLARTRFKSSLKIRLTVFF